ncbi:MAG: phosphoribosyltransferase family protein [Angelakisella sp.]
MRKTIYTNQKRGTQQVKYYDITVGGLKRSLPIVPISDTLSIASFVIFGDTEIVEPCARELAARLPKDIDYLITAEAKSIPLIYEMAKVMKMPKYIIARKSIKGYMANPIITEVKSITTDKKQILCVDESDIKLLCGKRIAIVDDVISTGGSIAAVEHLVTQAGGMVVARAAILAEGDAADRKDIIYLEKIPMFFK